MTETDRILFTFPSITVSLLPTSPQSTHLLEPTTAPLLLSTHTSPHDNDLYLRLRHSSLDVLIEASRELHKTSPSTFILDSAYGEINIGFPELHEKLTGEALEAVIGGPGGGAAQGGLGEEVGLTWEFVVAEFENEIDRFVSYGKNRWSLIDGPGVWGERNVGYDPTSYGSSSSKAQEAGYGGESSKAREAGYYDAPPAAGPSGSGNHGYPADRKGEGRVVLVDEENGSEVGEVGGMGMIVSEGVKPGSKDPVEIHLPPASSPNAPLIVRPVPADYLRDALSPAYSSSTLVSTAATASRLIVTTSAFLAEKLLSSAHSYTTSSAPTATPMTFEPSTHQRVAQFHSFSSSAAKFSSTTLGKVQHFAQNAGAKLSGAGNKTPQLDRDGNPKKKNPGILNKSLIAFNTVADSLDYASKSLLSAASTSATAVVGHKYGAEAGKLTEGVTGGVKNVGLVYIDASGVSRRAVVKGVAKGMVVGRVKGGGEVVVPMDGMAGVQRDGIPAGWGDGVLGGPNAGPPVGLLGHRTPPPGYEAAANYGGSSVDVSRRVSESAQGGQSGRGTPRPGVERSRTGFEGEKGTWR